MKTEKIVGEKLNHTSLDVLLLINKMSQRLLGTLVYEEVMQIICDGMSELFEIESAALYLLENDEDLMLGATTPPLEPGMPNELRRAKLFDHPRIQEVVSTRKPHLLINTKNAELSPSERHVIELRQLYSLVYFPLIGKDKLLGVIIIGTCSAEKSYSDQDLNLGFTVINQLTLALQNAQLYEDLENHKNNLEKMVEGKTEDLKLMNEELQTVNEEINATNDELYQKNEIVQIQKEEIESTLENLKNAQSQLIQSEKMASLGVLTAGIAHEINNPLNYILGGYTGIYEFFEENPHLRTEKLDFCISSIKTGVERTTAIVKGLNQFSRDKNDYNEDCNLQAIIDNCLIILYNSYKMRIDIKKDFSSDVKAIKGNIGQLHQVFLNILQNAIQAIPDKGSISIVTSIEDTSVIVKITDTGIGISQENLEKVTDPFFTTKDPGEGTGLGLSISYNIIKEHGGKIKFESESEIGTTVKLIFKQVKTPKKNQ